MACLLDEHDVGSPPTSIDGIAPGTAARLIAELGDPARFDSAAVLSAYVGVIPALWQSGKRRPTCAEISTIGNARLRSKGKPALVAVYAVAKARKHFEPKLAA
ncbi:IS110 family transposase [Azospirillum sp. RWY-5-1]|uniref:IS110 family transposase n=1 Tax=Azospirillum oleiclasticum TaxID=2735135 RepID=A0ABX2TMS2_9PROT|nr:IS110 family transposase [Azospirillum oleiclasticum]NYZ24877.1 IS110 family transposase [Azospirillum oleiclasticum]